MAFFGSKKLARYYIYRHRESPINSILATDFYTHKLMPRLLIYPVPRGGGRGEMGYNRAGDQRGMLLSWYVQ